MADDPLDDVLNLEEQFHQDGYKQGYEDGLLAGKIEGRGLGLEKGFEKFSESARLHGKAIMWANRLPRMPNAPPRPQETAAKPERAERTAQAPEEEGSRSPRQSLPDLPDNPRLAKHITTLHALVESESLSTDNTDEAVNDFDDRVRRAQGKAKIIEKMLHSDSTREKSHDGPDKPGTTE